MGDIKYQRHLLKFLLTAAAFLFTGTVQGVVQVMPGIRTWLDSIGSPISGPGHMIDPLAHAHINIVGGLVMIGMAMAYFLFEQIAGRPILSRRLCRHSYAWLAIGVCCFYSTLLFFGIWEGLLMNAGDMARQAEVHHIYGRVIAIASTIMGMGFWLFFINIFLGYRALRRDDA
jgi:heme/copper-type cytochrome/quinol oxidase subunit 1